MDFVYIYIIWVYLFLGVVQAMLDWERARIQFKIFNHK